MHRSRIQIWCFALLQLWLCQLTASLPLNSSTITLNLPSNFTQSSYPVHDPFAWHRPTQNEALKFYDFKTWLPGAQVTHLLDSASDDAGTHRGELWIEEPLRYVTTHVELVLVPGEGMNWWAWDTALWGMRMTMEDYGIFFEWSFKVVRRGEGEVGGGWLRWRRGVGEVREVNVSRVIGVN